MTDFQPTTRPSRTALITGGTRGIGRAIADQLAPDHHLIIVGSSETVFTVAADVRAQGYSAEGCVMDLRESDTIERAVRQLIDSRIDAPLPQLDVLIHCAGVVAHDPVTETSLEQWREAFEVNFFGVVELTRQLLPQLRAAHGTVVAINSGAGQHSGAGYGPYACTKFALKAYTDALREEHRGQFRVCSIHPGKTHSDMQVSIQQARGNEYDESRFMRPESVAQAVRFAIDATEDAMVESVTIRPSSGS